MKWFKGVKNAKSFPEISLPEVLELSIYNSPGSICNTLFSGLEISGVMWMWGGNVGTEMCFKMNGTTKKKQSCPPGGSPLTDRKADSWPPQIHAAVHSACIFLLTSYNKNTFSKSRTQKQMPINLCTLSSDQIVVDFKDHRRDSGVEVRLLFYFISFIHLISTSE